MSNSPKAGSRFDADCVVIGTGFSGLYAIWRLRRDGHSVRAFESGKDVGGVWYWNKYPGAQCDVRSRDYSYSFDDALQREWTWGKAYAPQKEIYAYAQHVADRFDLRKHISFQTRVTAATYDEKGGGWSITTDRGETLTARYCVMTCGHLSTPNFPDLPGMKEFKGEMHHTGRWPEKPVDFRNKRVAVIGVGSSGMQVIPQIAKDAAKLYVFQRTPQFVVPVKNPSMNQMEEDEFKAGYPEYRAMIRRLYPQGFYAYSKPLPSLAAVNPKEAEPILEEIWENGGPARFLRGGFLDTLTNKASNDALAEFVRGKIASIVKDKKVAAKLMPYDYPIGTKRLCYDSEGYYQTFNLPNVSLVDLRDSPLHQITAKGIETKGHAYEVDIIIFATGYDAFTGSLFNIDIRGRGGKPFKEKWTPLPINFLGMSVSEFPNMFIVEGPGSPSVFANVIAGAEQQVDWISNCITSMVTAGRKSIEAEPSAEAEWMEHCNSLANQTLLPLANSWWIGANIAGKTRYFYAYIGGLVAYGQKCNQVAAVDYQGFRFDGHAKPSEVESGVLTGT